MSASKMIEVALAEVGYLEKASNSQLNNKTANAGYNNWTKYGAWYGGGLNGQPWCDMFVSWVANEAGELSAVGKYAYVPSHIQYFKNLKRYFARGAQTPQTGDIIFFGDEAHVGIVEYVQNGYVHTIEGNTSGGTTLVDNGGGVHQKYYPLTSSYIMGYGRPAYSSNSNSSSSSYKWGIDVSTWQGTNNWSKIKTAGVSFAILRAGFRQEEDDTFAENAVNAISAGIPIGAYWFSYATSATEAAAEAKYCLTVIKNYKMTLPIFFDWEYDSYNKAAAKGITVGKTLFNDMAVAFCEVIAAAGYKAGVYYNLDFYNRFIDTSRLGKYYVWYAQYASSPDLDNYDIWQYSSSGSVNGVGSTSVDMNVLKNTKLLIQPGWKKDDTGWWYVNNDGSYTTNGWQEINGEWYYFNDVGYMLQDVTYTVNGITYIFDHDGHVTRKDEEDEDMTAEKFAELMNEYMNNLASQEPGKWSEDARSWAEANGLIQGDEKGRKMYKKPLTREEYVTVLKRVIDKYGLEK